MAELMRAPLDDPTYIPEHPPANGIIPDVVAKWGPKSQLRWFSRFQPQLSGGQPWSEYHVHSEGHLGICCFSCGDEYQHGTGVIMDGWCCCHDERTRT